MTFRKNLATAPLEPFQTAYLYHDGGELPRPKTMKEFLALMPLWKLIDGKCPVFLNPHKSMHPAALWRAHGAEVMRWWLKHSPDTRPLPWWHWDAPGSANMGMAPPAYIKAIKLANRRAAWPVEKQKAFIAPMEKTGK
jgi:hypothetical protein